MCSIVLFVGCIDFTLAENLSVIDTKKGSGAEQENGVQLEQVYINKCQISSCG